MLKVNVFFLNFRGQKMFEEMKTFISKETEVDFNGWSCLTALVLPNVISRADLKENVKQFNHKVITSSDDILTVLNLRAEFDVDKAYVELAKLLITSIHGASVKNAKGTLELQPVVPDIDKTYLVQAGSDASAITPGFNTERPDELLCSKDQVSYALVKAKPAFCLPVWIFWHPDQARILFKKALCQGNTRLALKGPYGSGKTQILMALALEAARTNKPVWFWSMLKEPNSQFNKYINHFCATNKIHFVFQSENKIENEQKIQQLEESHCEFLFVDELQVVRGNQMYYLGEQNDDKLLR